MEKYKEYYFTLPVDDIFKSRYSRPTQKNNLSTITSIVKKLQIDVDFAMLKMRSQSYKNGSGDVFVFENDLDKGTFLYMDFFLGWYDQIHMVEIGVRCPEVVSEEIRIKMRYLYSGAYIRSEFSEAVTELLSKKDLRNYPRLLKPTVEQEQYVGSLPEPYVQHIEIWVNEKLKYQM